jgi:transposase
MYACTGRYRISMGVTGMAIVRAIVGGERDARQLAQLRDRRCHQSEEAIAEQLSGHWRADHLFTLGQALKMYDAIQERIAEYEREIMEECRGQAAPKLDNPKKAQAIKKRGEEPLRQALYRISGVDLRRNECYIELWKALRR